MRPAPRARVDLMIVTALRQAILSNRKVRLHYPTAGQGNTVSIGSIPTAFLYGMRHYLVAWSESDWARDFRSFALSNIERVEILEKTFTRKRSFSLRAYAERSFGVFQEKPFDVAWRFSPQAATDARDFLFHPTQILRINQMVH